MIVSRLRIVKTLEPFISRFPGISYRIAVGVGWVGYHTQPRIRRNLVRNLMPLCDGNLARAQREGRRVCIFVAQYYVDLMGLPRRDLARFQRENLEYVNAEYIPMLDEPGPVVAVSCHTGNAELAIQAFSSYGRRFAALVEAQQPPKWSQYLLRLRSAGGGTFYETDFGGVRASLHALKTGEVLGVMGDRDIQGTGICTELFGRCVKLPRGPWELARRTNALVFPVFATRIKNDRFRLHLAEPFRVERTEDDEADIRLAVTRFAHLLEEHLRADPGQWVVLEDFWKVHSCRETGHE